MKSILQYLSAITILALILAVPARAQSVDVGLQSSIVYQTLDQNNDNNSLGTIAPGFQNAVGNVTLDAKLFDGGRAHVGMFISSKHHTEMYGYQGYFQMTKLPVWMDLGSFNDFYAEHLEAKAGQMTLNFGDGFLYRSVNGDVYNNELVGNPLASPALTTLGMEATAHAGMLHLMAGFSNGTTSGTVDEGKGIALHGKAWLTPLGDLARLSFSYYQVDHSANGTGYPNGGTKSYLFAGGDRAGSRYDIWDGPDGGQIFFGKEQDVKTFQFDGRLNLNPILIYGAAGWYKDADCNGTINGQDDGNPEDRWTHYMVTAKYNVTDWLYVASRYSTVRASKIHGDDSSGKVNRIQVGGGFKLYDGVLIKLEYAKQTASDFATGVTNNGVDLGLNPEFSGFSIETAVSL